MTWVLSNLAHYFVHDKAIYFILDASFKHSREYDRSINFICDVFNDLKPKDQLALHCLGDSTFDILLEEKRQNTKVKRILLNNLKHQVEEGPNKRRQIDFKFALDNAVKTMQSLPVQKVK